jgi:rod shape-determining protein MreD
MIYTLNILIVFILTSLSLSFFPNLAIFGVAPLLSLFFVILLAYFRKGVEPLILAAFTGIYLDFFSPYPLGLYLMLFLLVAAFVRYFFGEGMNRLSFWYYIAITEFSLLVYYSAQLIFLWTEGVLPKLGDLWPVIIGLLVNSVFAIIVYAAGLRYFDWVTATEDKLKRR